MAENSFLKKVFDEYGVSNDAQNYIFGKTEVLPLDKHVWWDEVFSKIKGSNKKSISLEMEEIKRMFYMVFSWNYYDYNIFGFLKEHLEWNYSKIFTYLESCGLDKYEVIIRAAKNAYDDDQKLIAKILLKNYKDQIISDIDRLSLYRENQMFKVFIEKDRETFQPIIKNMILNQMIDYSYSNFLYVVDKFEDGEEKEHFIFDIFERVFLAYPISLKNKNTKILKKYVFEDKEDKIFESVILKLKNKLYKNNIAIINEWNDLYFENMDRYSTPVYKNLMNLFTKVNTYKILEKVYYESGSDWKNLYENFGNYNIDEIHFLEFLCYENLIGYRRDDKFYKKYIKDKFEMVQDLFKTSVNDLQLRLIDQLWKLDKDKTAQFLIEVAPEITGASIKKEVAKYLAKHKDSHDKIIEMKDHKKSVVKEIAIRSIINMGLKKDLVVLKDVLKGKLAKPLKDLIKEHIIKMEGAKVDLDMFSLEGVIAEAKKLSSHYYINQLVDKECPILVWKEGEQELSSSVTKYLLYKFYQLKGFTPTLEVKTLKNLFTQDSYNKVVDYIYKKAQGGDFLYSMIALTKDEKYINIIKEEIKTAINRYRGAYAAKLVPVIASIGTAKALQTTDWLTLRKNAKDKRVNRAAESALTDAAKELKLTKEELLDYIIPDFGFSKTGEMELDFGPRQFIVKLLPDLSLSVKDKESGKSYKNLPKVGKTDDQTKGTEAAKKFKAIKKDLKNQVKVERKRLESGFSTNRLWREKNWLSLFVDNPVMKMFAINLIWGVYDDKGLKTAFRYLEDGTFNDVEEEEFSIPKDSKIGLVHPIELTEEQRDQWKEQLEDYEIVQPFNQIDRPIFYPEDNILKDKVINQFKGFMIPRFTLRNKLFNAGWERGVIEDAGCFYYYDKVYPNGLYVALNFLGDYIGNYDDNKEVPIYDVQLNKGGKNITVKDIPLRLFSELYYELKTVAESGTGFNEEWEKVDW